MLRRPTSLAIVLALLGAVLLVVPGGAAAVRPAHVELVSQADPDHPTMSADGRFVVFEAWHGKTQQVVLRDNRKHRTVIVSTRRGGTPVTMASSAPAISSDGRYVVYVSGRTRLTEDGVKGVGRRVLLWDRRTGRTRTITAPTGADVGYASPRISRDAAFVAYVSLAPAPAGSMLPTTPTEWVWTRSTGTSVILPTPGIGRIRPWSISDDGRYVLEEDLSTEEPVANSGLLVRDRNTGVFRQFLTVGPAYGSADGLTMAYVDVRFVRSKGDSHPALWDGSSDVSRDLVIPQRFVAGPVRSYAINALSSTGRYVVISVRCRDLQRNAVLLVDSHNGHVRRIARTLASSAAVDARRRTVAYVDDSGDLRLWRRAG